MKRQRLREEIFFSLSIFSPSRLSSQKKSTNMKKILSFVAMASLFSATAFAQPTPAANASSTEGSVVLFDNTTVSGPATDNIRKKGEVVITNNGKKIKYKAADVSSVQIGNARFITFNYTFYEVVSEGKNFSLLRKANEPSGVQQIGSEVIAITSEGDVDDLFVRKAGANGLQLLTKKNIREVLGVCAGDVKDAELESVRKAVEDCNR
jgi:hypothetical protein